MMSRVVEQKSTNHVGPGHETHRYMQVPEVTNAVFSGCWEEGVVVPRAMRRRWMCGVVVGGGDV